MSDSIQAIQRKITPILEQNGVEYAGIFGSVVRGEDTPISDVDILVRFGKGIGMFGYMRLLNSLEAMLEKKVDLVTENGLNKFVKPYAMQELQTIYEKR